MRPIDGDVLKKKMICLANAMQDIGYSSYASAVGEVISFIEKSDTLDVPTVVRCKDCKYWGRGSVKWWERNHSRLCSAIGYGFMTAPSFYCGIGAKMDGGNNNGA